MSRPIERDRFENPHPSLWQAVLREPLVHFAWLGGLLYGGYVLLRPVPPERLVIPSELVMARRADLLRREGHPPSAEGVQAALSDYVDEEILFREAVRRRLGEGDIIIRRRLVQKMEYVADALLPRHPPSDDELAALVSAHPERYVLPPRIALRQVFISHDRHPRDAESVAQRIARELPAEGGQGDPHPLGPLLPLHSEAELTQIFSAELAKEALRLPEGQWSRPLPSAHGLHLIRVTARQAGQLPLLPELRERLRLEYDEQQRPLRRRQAIDSLRSRYQVVSPPEPGR